ncbi:hypothetical protein P5F54_06415 [Clostridium perfringens]|nr:hypothetical protein [Clostridium perfringens]
MVFTISIVGCRKIELAKEHTYLPFPSLPLPREKREKEKQKRKNQRKE